MQDTWYMRGHIFNQYLQKANYAPWATTQKWWLLWFRVTVPCTMSLKHNFPIAKNGNLKDSRCFEVHYSEGELCLLKMSTLVYSQLLIDIEIAKVIETEWVLKFKFWKTISVEETVSVIGDTHHPDMNKPQWIGDLFQYGIQKITRRLTSDQNVNRRIGSDRSWVEMFPWASPA